MSVRAKWLWAIFGLVAIGVSVFMVRTFSAAGQFTSLPVYGSQACFKLKDIPGAEDITIDRQAGVVYISSFNRRATQAKRGEIYRLDLKLERAAMVVTPMTEGLPEAFAPLGMSLFAKANGKHRLFVINRAISKTPSVELFDLEGDQLKHVKTITSPGITTPNNLVAVGDEQFYLTNDGLQEVGAIRAFFDFANQKKKGNVIYFDGKSAKPAATGFVMANGIAKNSDGKVLYVSDSYARTLKFFARDDKNALTEIGDLFVGTGLDNIDVDERGHIWIGAHPKLLDFYYLSKSPKNISPSQLIEAVPGVKEGGKMRTVFLDKGKRLSGSSIGVRYKDKLFMGGAYASGILVCDIPKWEDKKKP